MNQIQPPSDQRQHGGAGACSGAATKVGGSTGPSRRALFQCGTLELAVGTSEPFISHNPGCIVEEAEGQVGCLRNWLAPCKMKM